MYTIVDTGLAKFLANKSCIDARGKNDLLNNIEWVLKNGLYSGLQVSLCRDVRFVMMSVSPEQRKDNNKELLRVFFHEIYHSLQNDLRNNCSGPNDLWVIEAAAEYFAKYYVSIFDNSQQDFVQSIFHEVVQNASRHGFKLEDPGVAEKGLGALRLKIEEGWLDESRILNGSLFHNCARVKEFQDNDPKIQYLKDNWFKIEKHNGTYKFNTSMTKADVKNQFLNSDEEEIETVNYNTKLDEVCRGLINNNWNSYLNINKNEFNSKGYMFVVAGEDGRCESGIGRIKENALNECTKWQEENNIIGVCEFYAEGEEVVWDGSVWDD
mgnify:FL=1